VQEGYIETKKSLEATHAGGVDGESEGGKEDWGGETTCAEELLCGLDEAGNLVETEDDDDAGGYNLCLIEKSKKGARC
jgi:hypothetical protein